MLAQKGDTLHHTRIKCLTHSFLYKALRSAGPFKMRYAFLIYPEVRFCRPEFNPLLCCMRSPWTSCSVQILSWCQLALCHQSQFKQFETPVL